MNKMVGYFDNEIGADEFRLIVSMFPETKDLVIKNIQERVGYSYERMHHYLKSLAKKKIISEKKVGKTLVYSIDTNSEYAKRAYNEYSSLKALKFSLKHKMISKALQETSEEFADLIMVFGSYAKGTERKDSDIDIIIVSSEKKNAEIVLTSIKRQYGLNFHLIILPKTEFAKIKLENKELWESLVISGILFKGYETFYNYAYKNRQD